MAMIPEIAPQELKRRLDAGETITVLDVREPWECAIARLTGSVNIPLNDIPARLHELDSGAELVVMCKVGGRSRRAAEYLSAHAFGRVANLAGGIDAWAREIDPTLSAY
ncbi:MAG TPA: rhodanese-like domain-containing protein [Steroidobacteraceae bacterium]